MFRNRAISYNSRSRSLEPCMQSVPPPAEVTIYSPLFSPFRQPLEGSAVSIGRASDCSIPIKDRYLSRKHAEIIAVGTAWMLKDLGSANGTYLNGSRVERDELLKGGDRIRLGDTEIVFETAERNTDKLLAVAQTTADRKSTRLNSSHGYISYAVFCLKKKKNIKQHEKLTHQRKAEGAATAVRIHVLRGL